MPCYNFSQDGDHPPCKHSCGEKLTCGHFCAGICSDWYVLARFYSFQTIVRLNLIY